MGVIEEAVVLREVLFDWELKGSFSNLGEDSVFLGFITIMVRVFVESFEVLWGREDKVSLVKGNRDGLV